LTCAQQKKLKVDYSHNNNNNRSFNMVKTSAQPYKHIIAYMHTYTITYNEQPVKQDSNDAAHTLP